MRAYLGIDSGSTTTKFVLMDEEENILDSFYSPNQGAPLDVAKKALLELRDRYRSAGAELEILGVGTTGYGEQLFANAFSAECHVVETVAHARAAAKYVPNATFLLDIGGQDMKAIWLSNGVITNIVVNEACSSGCGSFLENFAASLHIPVDQIAQAAFDAQNPAQLGSRCTVFMNSSIVTEQRNGKLPGDIMAGLCRSIIENVFTKVIRISNLDSLGDTIVVQGGTFRNDAVLRALEQYTGRSVIRAPYPGVMGAIGAALLTKERMAGQERTFIGLDALEDFTYTQQANSPCPFCANHCKRTIITFSNGSSWVTNNRCERGEILGDPRDEAVREQLQAKNQEKEKIPNLFQLREKLLFQEYPVSRVQGAAGHGHRPAPGAVLLGHHALLVHLLPRPGVSGEAVPPQHPEDVRERPVRRHLGHRLLPRQAGPRPHPGPGEAGGGPDLHAVGDHRPLGEHPEDQRVHVRRGEGLSPHHPQLRRPGAPVGGPL